MPTICRARWKIIPARKLQGAGFHPFEPYREVHEQNLKLVHDYWKGKTLPEIAPQL